MTHTWWLQWLLGQFDRGWNIMVKILRGANRVVWILLLAYYAGFEDRAGWGHLIYESLNGDSIACRRKALRKPKVSVEMGASKTVPPASTTEGTSSLQSESNAENLGLASRLTILGIKLGE